MKVLVTGATGVIGGPTIAALLRRGHAVRLYSRHASESAKLWPRGVDAADGDIADRAAMREARRGCDAVLPLAGIVSEHSGDGSFEQVNVDGTRRAVEAAEAAGVRRFVYVSSLGAERGTSAYHRSKFKGEEYARTFPREWVVLRPGNVYGPGDEVISLLLKMVRVLPVVPAIDGGEHPFQPVWVEDLAEALAQSVERDDLVGRTYDLTGTDLTSMNNLMERFEKITGRSPLRVPTPGFLVVLGARAASLLGVHIPLDGGQVQMLEEGNLIRDPERNALTKVFHVTPTSLDDGLRKLADTLPEQLPDGGVGSMVRRHVWADIAKVALSPEQLFERFRRRFAEITPWHVEVGAEPGTPFSPELGQTLTMHLPLRGNVQVRVEELSPLHVTLVTVAGHPIAGAVGFRIEPVAPGRVRFHVEVHDRPWDLPDWLVMSTVGGRIQIATWRATVDNLVTESGGELADGIHDESESLHGAEARAVEAWVRAMVDARRRDLHAQGLSEAAEGSR